MSKIYGELEKAIMEQIAATSTTPAIPGRFYADTTNTASVIPRFYNGTAWLAMQLAQTTPVISQNSGMAVTVNWANGLNQQVILTNNCVISFSNPVSGSQHNLVVTQGASSGISPAYAFTFNMIDQDSRRGSYQPIGIQQPGQSQMFSWFYSLGIKAAYATFPNVTFAAQTITATASLASDISPSGKNIIIPNATSPFSFVYQIFDGGIKPEYGAKALVTSATAAAALIAAKYSPDGNAIFTVSGTTPFLQGWYVDRDTPVGSAWANPVTIPTGAGHALAVHPSASFVVTGHATTPFMSAYPYSGAGFGTKLANPVQLPDAQVNAIAWSPQGDYLTAVSQTTPFIRTWAFTSTPGSGAIGAVASNPGTLPTNGPAADLGKQVAWRPQGDFIAMTTGATSPFLYVVPFNRATGAYGTALTITALSGQAMCVAWTPDGQYLLVGTGTAPFLYCFDFSSGTIGTTIAFDGSNPGQQVNDIVISPDGSWAHLSLNASVFLTGIMLPTKLRSYLRINV